MISAEAFMDNAENVLAKLRNTQLPHIKEAAAKLAECIHSGGVVHLFGTGHSKLFAMEMSNRAGGLGPMHMIKVDDLIQRGIRNMGDMDDPEVERDPALAHELLDFCDIRSGDAAVIISNSGRNGALVEMALLLKGKGLPVICVTSMEHTTSVTSRHPSGKRLFEVADEVIDNCAPLGDALLSDSRLPAKVCSISSVAGSAIAQCLNAEIIRNLLDRGDEVPVLISANLDGSDEWNERIRNAYAGRI